MYASQLAFTPRLMDGKNSRWATLLGSGESARLSRAVQRRTLSAPRFSVTSCGSGPRGSSTGSMVAGMITASSLWSNGTSKLLK